MRITARMIFYKYLVYFGLLLMYSVFILGGGAWQAGLSLTVLYLIIFAPILWIDNQLQEIQRIKPGEG